MHHTSAGEGTPSSERLATRRRRDIQGLRATAVLLVALDHAGVGFLKGGYVGVDVFFVLSGYLITGLLVSAVENAGSRNYYSGFYARRARRILPAATLTLIATDVAASHLLNLERAHQTLVDSISAAFFVANFHFASIGTNYFAMGQPPSPLQHFWSLSVEEQFYLVWPLLVLVSLLGITLRARRRHGNHTARTLSRGAFRRLELVAAVATLASLVYAVYYTHHNSTAAYFSSPARAWELGLGAVLSLNVRRVAHLPSGAASVLGWLGIVAILAASTMYSASTLFPGLPALLPTIGAAAVIAAGLHVDQARFAPSRVLSLRPFRYVGDRSYTFYLWHWPVLILAMEHAGHKLSLTVNLLLLIGAFLLSIFTYALFENPLRQTVKLRGSAGLLLWPVAIAAVLFVISLHWSDYQDAVNLAYSPAKPEVLKEAPEASLVASTDSAHSGWRPSSPAALVAAVAAVNKSARLPGPLTPSPLALSSAVYLVPHGCIAAPGEVRSSICSFGDTSSKRTLVVFGDSHAQMWLPAIVGFAQHEGYDVRPIMKYSCTAPKWAGPERSSECAKWYRWAVSQARALHPSLLILVTHYDDAPVDAEIAFTGPNSVANISAFGKSVRSSVQHIVVLGDPPGQEKEPVDCLLASHATMKTCSYSQLPKQIETTANLESATRAFGEFLDTTPWFCYQLICPMVVGHTVVYVDDNHMSTAYAEELAPLFRTALTRVLARPGTAQPVHHAASPAAPGSTKPG